VRGLIYNILKIFSPFSLIAILLFLYLSLGCVTSYTEPSFIDELALNDQAISYDLNNASLWHNRGEILENLSLYEDAFLSYDKALSLGSENPLTWKNRIDTLKILGRDKEAYDSYDNCNYKFFRYLE